MNQKLNLTSTPITKLLKHIAIPSITGSLFQTLFNIVDTFYAGKISPEALSALGKSFPIYFIIIAASIGVTVAGTSLIGNSIGEKNEKNTLYYFTHIIFYGIFISILIAAFGLNYSENNAFGTGKRVNIGINDSNWRKSYFFDYGDPYYTIDGVSRGYSIFFNESDYGQYNIAAYTLSLIHI